MEIGALKIKKNDIKRLYNVLLGGPFKVVGCLVGRWKKIENFDFEKSYKHIISSSGCYFYGDGFYIKTVLRDRTIAKQFYKLNKGIYIFIYDEKILKNNNLQEFTKDLYNSIEWDAGGITTYTGKKRKESDPFSFFGPWYINNIINKEKLLQVPSYKIEELPDGGVLLQHDEDIFNYDSFWKRRSCKKFEKNISKCFVSDKIREQKEEQRNKELGITIRAVYD